MMQVVVLAFGLGVIWALARFTKRETRMSRHWLHEMRQVRPHDEPVRRWDWHTWDRKW